MVRLGLLEFDSVHTEGVFEKGITAFLFLKFHVSNIHIYMYCSAELARTNTEKEDKKEKE